MKISTSNIKLSSQYDKIHLVKETEKLNVWNNKTPTKTLIDRVEVSKEAKELNQNSELPAELQEIIIILEKLMGKKINFLTFEEFNQKMNGNIKNA